MDKRPFRIYKSMDGTVPHHGKWHPEKEMRLRYLDLQSRSGVGSLTGHVNPEEFTAVMRALVSSDYDSPNWCEKCHLAGNDGCCRCDPACNE
jgi:hypothetical protein